MSNLEAGLIRPAQEYQTIVSSLEKRMTTICQALKPFFETGRYGLIVGDDTSGRLPTLIMKGFADYVSDTNSNDHLPTVFLQAGGITDYKSLDVQFETRVMHFLGKDDNKKALIVTEYVKTGETIQRLTQIFQSHDIPFDLAVVMSVLRDGKFPASLPKDTILVEGTQIEYHYRMPPPMYWDCWEATGLIKATKNNPLHVLRGDERRNKVLAARVDVRLAVENIIEEIYSSVI